MQKYDLAIIGSGIGGSLIGALNKDKSHILFEKDSNLGGCASTFKRFGNYYNAGATTFVGYEDNHLIKNIFKQIGYVPDIVESKIAIRTIQNKKVVDRIRDFEIFLSQIQENYPNKNNRIFWEKIKSIDEKFWQIKNIHFAKYSLKSYLKSLLTFKDLIGTFEMDLFKSANSFIKETLGEISQEYQSFIDAQLLITVQSKSKDVSLLSMSLGLSYPFHKVFYVNNGMGTIIEDLLKDVNVHKNEEIIKIRKSKDSYIINSSKGEYKAKNIVLNTTIYDSKNLFDKKIKNYYEKFDFSDQSAFTTYLTINSKEEFLEHYQIILKPDIPNCISNSFFISFSKLSDEKMSQNGYSVTISTHTKVTTWKILSKDDYKKQKELTQNFILEHFLDYFDNINIEQITKIFSATCLTFQRFIGRANCGGKAINVKSALQIPSCRTPFKGLYNVGDTIFAGQGWPGVALGASILNKELNEKL
ncbi:NAD(P)-binding protein [Arcobacter sp. F2176]|uniref:NAD(P)-binding protein n=1 Tax=Arcobacter sp. F2176 TaxID=2044511 RepID=UPI00100BFB30|nr:NAD(P)-binding protein [Arcobacter sp. F2176]RXJ80933.1 carotene isomerase [Arcobacter sp. F2176]